jgi:hypothetical protein
MYGLEGGGQMGISKDDFAPSEQEKPHANQRTFLFGL